MRSKLCTKPRPPNCRPLGILDSVDSPAIHGKEFYDSEALRTLG